MATYDLIPSHFTSNLNDVLTIELVAKELTHMSGFPRSEDGISTGDRRSTFKFVAPEEIAENISHNWEEYESPATKLAQKMGQLKRAIGTGEHLAQSGTQTVKGVDNKGGVDVSALEGAAARMSDVTLAGGGGILNYRVDSPLVYKNSQRREYTLTFPIGSYDTKTNEEQIYNTIKELERLSCPEMRGEMIRIKFPSIFTVRTSPVSIINIRKAALVAVQPTWKQPYRNGFSMNVELQLTFRDLEPLYSSNIEKGQSIVRGI